MAAALLWLAPLGAAQATLHVDASVTGGAGDGSSWSDAFDDLQGALAVATSGDSIWVAAGTYTPAPPGGSRDASFVVPDGVLLYGGFDGTEATLAERAGLFQATLLDGDLDGDDGPDFTNRADNSRHVVRRGGDVLVDGFGLRGGSMLSSTDEDDNGPNADDLEGDSVGSPQAWRDALVQAKNGNEQAIISMALIGDADVEGSICQPLDPMTFEVDEFRKYCLLNGLDDIGLTMQHADEIRAFEADYYQRQPWLK